jgi:hypothetical protein
MMGQLSSGQDKLLYLFNLDSHVPREHPLREAAITSWIRMLHTCNPMFKITTPNAR